MKRDNLILLARLRLLVGYIGEQRQPPWWPSSFFAPSSPVFLAPVFGKMSFLARYYGVKEAAAKVHDEHIGVGRGVFHLFRFPEALEEELHGLLSDSEVLEQVNRDLSSETGALKALELCGKTEVEPLVGPVRIGGAKDLEKSNVWQIAARHYWQAFETNTQIFPYFTEGL